MSNPLSVVVALALFLSVRLDAHAQLFVFPQGDAAWKVDTTTQSGSDAPPAPGAKNGLRPYAVHVEVTQLNKVKRIQITWSDGKTTEKWNIPGLPVEFYQDPRTGLIRTLQNGGPSLMSANKQFSYDAFAFGWIQPGLRVEKDPVTYQQKQCFHYLGNSTPIPGLVTPPDKREAWIDAKTLLPVGLNIGNMVSIFKFQDKPPTGTLTPPSAVQTEIVYYKAVMGYP